MVLKLCDEFLFQSRKKRLENLGTGGNISEKLYLSAVSPHC